MVLSTMVLHVVQGGLWMHDTLYITKEKKEVKKYLSVAL